MTFLEVYNGVNKFYDDIANIIADILTSHQDLIIDLVKEQLLSGRDSDNNLLAPEYLNDPHFRSNKRSDKPKKKGQKSAAERYFDKKKELEDKHNKMKKFGNLFDTKPEGVPNLIVNGNFHEGIYINIMGQTYVIDSTYEDSDAIQRKYNYRVLDLNKVSIDKLTELIRPELEKALNDRYG